MPLLNKKTATKSKSKSNEKSCSDWIVSDIKNANDKKH